MLENLQAGFEAVFQLRQLGFIVMGSVIGLWIGIIPGLGPVMAMAILIPFTFALDPLSALLLLASIHAAGSYGGSISSILLNVPGEATSAATTFDGYPMARDGKARVALGLSLGSSVVGALVGVTFLVTLSPVIASIALRFGPAEYFSLALLGLSVVAFASPSSTIKGLIMACLGLSIGFVGMDSVLGSTRYTYGSIYLQDGLPWISIIIGLFALSELIKLALSGGTISLTGKLGGSVWDGVRLIFSYPKTLVRSALIGAGIGAMPGVGATTANFLAYGAAVQASRTPERFGKGEPEGVIAPEVSNNASVSASLIPTLTLGIPGGAGAAILLTAVTIHGLRPGPSLFTSEAPMLYGFFIGLLLSVLVFFVCGMLMTRWFAKITVLRVEILVPLLIVVSLIGTYAVKRSFEDVVVAGVFGIIGYVLRQLGFPIISFVIGLILGTLAETSFHQALMISGGDYTTFVTRPISAGLIVLTLIMIGWPAAQAIRSRYARGGSPAADRSG